MTVEVDLGVYAPTDFVLDDASRGVLNGTAFTLSAGYTDVTTSAMNASVSRGRTSRLWDAMDAGNATVVFQNRERLFDPAYIDGQYYGELVAGKRVRLIANDTTVYSGFTEDLRLDYDVSTVSTTALLSTDALGMLGQLQFDDWTSGGLGAGDKLTDVCERAEVAWPSDLRDFNGGVETLQANTIAWGTNVLNYCQLVARSDLGYLFASADGVLTFRDRNVAVGAVSAASVGDGGIPFNGITAIAGSELLFSRVGVTREGGSPTTAVTADAIAWRAAFGPLRSLSITGVLLATDAQSLDLAEYLLTLYDTPRYRVSELVFELHGLETADQDTLLAVDITDTVDVTFTPNGVGDPIVQVLVVQGIRHDITPSTHRLTWSVMDAPLPFFRLDSSTYGVLDSDVLGF